MIFQENVSGHVEVDFRTLAISYEVKKKYKCECAHSFHKRAHEFVSSVRVLHPFSCLFFFFSLCCFYI